MLYTVFEVFATIDKILIAGDKTVSLVGWISKGEHGVGCQTW